MTKIILFFIGIILFTAFMLFIVPIWLGLHYRWKAQVKNTLSQQEIQRIQALQSQAEKLEQRVKILETILDDKAPDWKKPQ